VKAIKNILRRSIFAALFLVFVAVAGTIHADAQTRPLAIKDAMKLLDLAERTSISLSPDGEWVAYTVENDSKRVSTIDLRYSYYTPTGAFTEAVGCDIWLTNTKTNETRNLTGGKGTSWAPVWSPDGKNLAFYSDRSGTAHLWVWEQRSGQMRQLSDAIVRPFFNFQAPRWSPDSKSIVVKALAEGLTVEGAADRLFGPKKKEESRVSGSLGGVTATVLSFVPAPLEGDATTKKKPEKPDEDWTNRYLADLVRVDVKTGKAEHVVKDVKPLGYWFAPDGKSLLYTHWTGMKENTQQATFDIRLYTFADGSSRQVVGRAEMDYGIAVSWAPDSRSIAYVTAGPQTKGDCYWVPIEGGEPQLLTPGDHPTFADDHRAPLWDSSGKFIYLISAENYGRLGTDKVWKSSVIDHKVSVAATIPGRVILEVMAASGGGRVTEFDNGKYLVVATRDERTKKEGCYKIDTTSGETSRLYEADVYLARDLIFAQDVSRDQKTVVFVSQDAQHPEDIWTVGPGFQDPKRISTINKDLEGTTFGGARVIEYYSVDGELLHGALLLPANYEEGKKYPLIVDPYGGSYRSETVFRFGLSGAGVENLQILATRGYAALLPDTPMHGNSPMSDLLKTVIPAVDRVVELGIADPNRLGIMGHSYGGYSTLALIVQTTRFKAAVDSAGPADLVSDYGIMDEKGSSWAIGWAETGQGRMGGTPWQFRDRYIENSPFYFLDRVQTPLLIIQGSLDTAVPRQQADGVFVALRRLGKEVTYANYAGEEHWEGTWGVPNVVDYWTRVIDWFDKHMPASEAAK
jgi:dipeptidyl aminopeptidase/acylaminoacyl peptidase